MDKLPMTAEGLKSLEDELKRLRGEERPAVIKAIEVAASTAISQRMLNIRPPGTVRVS